MEGAALVEAWRSVTRGLETPWVLFANGTCVFLREPEAELARQATELLREWGPVHAGTPAGDFNVHGLRDPPGWVVTCHHADVLTCVAPGDVDPDGASDLMVGLLGRSKRAQDAGELRVLHVEDRRGG